MNFKVDTGKCINCGLCVSDCPVMILHSNLEFPAIKEGREGDCLKCQHCLAICPKAAISIWDKDPADSLPATKEGFDSQGFELLIKTNRSIRKFKDEEIDEDIIKHVVTVSSYAATAKNDNAVQFTVISNKRQMLKFKELLYGGIKEASDSGNLPESFGHFDNFQKLWYDKGIDILFRGAPYMLVTSGADGCYAPVTDAIIAITHFDLVANSEGIGTLWNGFVQTVIDKVVPELRIQLGIPENHKIGGVMVFGKPGVTYARSIQNESPQIKTVRL